MTIKEGKIKKEKIESRMYFCPLLTCLQICKYKYKDFQIQGPIPFHLDIENQDEFPKLHTMFNQTMQVSAKLCSTVLNRQALYFSLNNMFLDVT